MEISMLLRLSQLLVAIFLASAAPSNAQNSSGYGGSASGGYGGSMGGEGPSGGLSSRVTNKVVKTINRASRECQSLPKVYRYDC